MRRVLALLIWALLAVPSLVLAQSYPDYESTTVNDFAWLLDAGAEARVSAQLKTLRKETGVEMTVVTLSRQEVFAPDQSLEQFATGLFNNWGIGDKTRNDGVLVLVLREDRAMRIELGAGFERDWDRASAKVIDRSFLPAFKEDRYQDGIETGVADVIETVVMPFLGGEDAPKARDDSFIWIVVAAVFAAFGIFSARDKLVSLKKCPNCGTRWLSRTREVKVRASKTMNGSGEVTTSCANCTYHHMAPYSIARASSSSSSSFGGGSSGGGGASGRW
jgi:uncharacterized protein